MAGCSSTACRPPGDLRKCRKWRCSSRNGCKIEVFSGSLGPIAAPARDRNTVFEVSVEDTFAAGHALRGDQSKGENTHGHNYKVRITLAGEQLDEIGLLLDFKEVKSAMNQVIDRL